MLTMSGEKVKFLSDRSIPEIVRLNKDVPNESLQQYCKYLHKVGVDFLEIDQPSLTKLCLEVSGAAFIYRIIDRTDVENCLAKDLNYCLITPKMLPGNEALERMLKADKKIILEIELPQLRDLHHLMALEDLLDLRQLHGIRLSSSCLYLHTEWSVAVSFIKDRYKVNVDVCPENRLFMATALALEAARIKEVDYITAAFTGTGGQAGFAPLEELLVALQVVKGVNTNGNLQKLARLAQIYRKLAKYDIPPGKPIIGTDIFKYESGIHAAGIEKNPAAYEPFDPGLVGKRREMVLGKHSGSRSVTAKLAELGINEPPANVHAILEQVREKSIKLKRAIRNSELISIWNKLGQASPH